MRGMVTAIDLVRGWHVRACTARVLRRHAVGARARELSFPPALAATFAASGLLLRAVRIAVRLQAQLAEVRAAVGTRGNVLPAPCPGEAYLLAVAVGDKELPPLLRMAAVFVSVAVFQRG